MDSPLDVVQDIVRRFLAMQINHTGGRFNQRGISHKPHADDGSTIPIQSSQERINEDRRDFLNQLASGTVPKASKKQLVLELEPSVLQKFGKVAEAVEKPNEYYEPSHCVAFLRETANDDMLAIADKGLDKCLELKIPATYYIWGLSCIAANQKLTGALKFQEASDLLIEQLQKYPLAQYNLMSIGTYIRRAFDLPKDQASEYIDRSMAESIKPNSDAA